MLAHTGVPGVTVHAPAKLNLYFELLSRRNDGFHDVETLMVPVTLFDTLVFRDLSGRSDAGPRRIRFVLSQTYRAGAGEVDEPGVVPDGAENIVVRAVELLRERSGIDRGADVGLVKRIPVAAGLGGGSSDAAAALLAANVVWRLGWPQDRLAELALEVGSDVPFFLARGPQLCRGRGEQLDKVSGIGDVHAVIVHPPQGLSTAAVYRNSRVPDHPGDVQRMLAGLRSGCLRRVRNAMRNRLQETAAHLSPWIGQLKQEFEMLNCPAHQMSGSGSSYFGICRHARHARRMAARLRSRNLGRVFTVRRAC